MPSSQQDVCSICLTQSAFPVFCSLFFPRPLDFFSGQPSRLVLVAGLTAFSGHILQVVLEQPLFIHSDNVLANKIVTGTQYVIVKTDQEGKDKEGGRSRGMEDVVAMQSR